MVRGFVLAAAFTLVALPVSAAQWQVVHDKSRLGFVGTKNGKEFTGEFKSFSADIAFDPQALGQSKVVVNVDTGSIETEFPDDENQAARNKDWFYVDKYPKAVFETTSIRRTGENSYAADAKLTIRGVTQNISLPFTLDIAGDTAKMEGAVTINRGAFGVGQGRFAEGKWFGLDVKVTVDLTAKRK